MRDRLHVIGVDAAPHAAKMVYFHSVRDGPAQEFVGQAVRTSISAEVDRPIPALAGLPHPNPASRPRHRHKPVPKLIHPPFSAQFVFVRHPNSERERGNNSGEPSHRFIQPPGPAHHPLPAARRDRPRMVYGSWPDNRACILGKLERCSWRTRAHSENPIRCCSPSSASAGTPSGPSAALACATGHRSQ